MTLVQRDHFFKREGSLPTTIFWRWSSLKLNGLHLKIDAWKTSYFFWEGLDFWGYDSFREGNTLILMHPIRLTVRSSKMMVGGRGRSLIFGALETRTILNAKASHPYPKQIASKKNWWWKNHDNFKKVVNWIAWFFVVAWDSGSRVAKSLLEKIPSALHTQLVCALTTTLFWFSNFDEFLLH